jgi:hypothetical protein
LVVAIYRRRLKARSAGNANEKREGPSTIIEYVGLAIDTVNMLIKIPEKKVQDLLKKIKLLSYRKKVTLKELQSICGSLAFCAKALPAGHVVSRRLYMATTKTNFFKLQP